MQYHHGKATPSIIPSSQSWQLHTRTHDTYPTGKTWSKIDPDCLTNEGQPPDRKDIVIAKIKRPQCPRVQKRGRQRLLQLSTHLLLLSLRNKPRSYHLDIYL
jgi:hypothetical protein